ncbi:unnamed protein product, partial [Prorocentrum cordatum]
MKSGNGGRWDWPSRRKDGEQGVLIILPSAQIVAFMGHPFTCHNLCSHRTDAGPWGARDLGPKERETVTTEIVPSGIGRVEEGYGQDEGRRRPMPRPDTSTQAGFGEHTAGQAHFKHLRWLQEVCSRDVNTYWQKLCVPGGGYRFNHATGELQVCRVNPGESLPVDPAEQKAPPLESPLLSGAAPMPMLTAGPASPCFPQ